MSIFGRYERAFRATFLDKNKKLKPQAELVMEYLAEASCAMKRANTSDPHELLKIEGRREIFYDICKLLKYDYSLILDHQEKLNDDHKSFFNLNERTN